MKIPEAQTLETPIITAPSWFQEIDRWKSETLELDTLYHMHWDNDVQDIFKMTHNPDRWYFIKRNGFVIWKDQVFTAENRLDGDNYKEIESLEEAQSLLSGLFCLDQYKEDIVLITSQPWNEIVDDIWKRVAGIQIDI